MNILCCLSCSMKHLQLVSHLKSLPSYSFYIYKLIPLRMALVLLLGLLVRSFYLRKPGNLIQCRMKISGTFDILANVCWVYLN